MKQRLIKKEKIKKQSHAYKGYARTYNVEILISDNPARQLKGIKSKIRDALIIRTCGSIGFRVLKNSK